MEKSLIWLALTVTRDPLTRTPRGQTMLAAAVIPEMAGDISEMASPKPMSNGRARCGRC